MDKKILETLKNHGIIAFPTETVMGLGVLYDDFSAYTNLNKLKRRPEDKPYTMMLGSTEDIEKYAFIDEKAKKIMQNFMPGPVTILVKVKNCVPEFVTHSTGVVGIRVPADNKICEIINEIKKPLLVPSANRSGEAPALTSEEVKTIFGEEVGYVVEGKAGGEKPSTIIDLTQENYKIIREGPISESEIRKVLEIGGN